MGYLLGAFCVTLCDPFVLRRSFPSRFISVRFCSLLSRISLHVERCFTGFYGFRCFAFGVLSFWFECVSLAQELTSFRCCFGDRNLGRDFVSKANCGCRLPKMKCERWNMEYGIRNKDKGSVAQTLRAGSKRHSSCREWNRVLPVSRFFPFEVAAFFCCFQSFISCSLVLFSFFLYRSPHLSYRTRTNISLLRRLKACPNDVRWRHEYRGSIGGLLRKGFVLSLFLDLGLGFSFWGFSSPDYGSISRFSFLLRGRSRDRDRT